MLSKGMRLSVRLKLLIFKYVDFKNKNQGVIKGNLLYTGKISGRNLFGEANFCLFKLLKVRSVRKYTFVFVQK